MIFTLIFSVLSFKVLKNNQGQAEDTSKSVVIQNSKFQSQHFLNDKHKGNKISNAIISNSNFKFKGSKNTILSFDIVNFNNNTIQLDSDFEASPVEIGSGKSTIYNLTLNGLMYKDNSLGIFSFDSSDIEIIKLNCKGTLKSTLFKGTVTGFSLKESTIQNFQKDDTHDIRSAIFLSHLTCENKDVEFTFHNNTFKDNKIPVFELASEIDCNVKVSESIFTNNKASSGSCILISDLTSSKSAKKIIIHNNTFTENENTGRSGVIKGALYVNTAQATFSGDNYFYNNYATYNGPETSDEYGAYGASIYIQQTLRDSFTLEGLYFEGDSTSHAGSSIFIYGIDTSGINRGNDIKVYGCTFTNCKSDSYGGAISTGIAKTSGDVSGNNDIIISYCVFNGCEASGGGGAIYVPLGTKRGDESTAIEYCQFINCDSYDGSAIYCASHEFTFEHSTFENINKDPSYGKVIISLYLKDAPTNPLAARSSITNCTFTGCQHSILKTDEDSNANNIVTFEQCKFESNTITAEKKSNQGLFDFGNIKSLSLNIESCNFTSNTGSCILAEVGITKCSFINCRFEKNTCSQGSVFYVKRVSSIEDKEYVTINNCQFIDSTVDATSGSVNAALHIPLNYVIFEGINTFDGNKATYKGSSVSKQNCACGGSILFECLTNTDATFANLQIMNSFASNYGGGIGIYCETGSQIKLNFAFENCLFSQCESETGGAVYLDENDKVQYEITINRCVFEKCTAPSGSAMYGQIYKFELANTVFDGLNGEKVADPNHKPTLLYINLKTEGADTTVNNCTFSNNNQFIQFISSTSKLTPGSITTFTKCNFNNNCRIASSLTLLQLDYIQSETINFDSCIFKHNGGRCIIQESDTISNVNIKKCEFSYNNGTAGCAICVTTASSEHKMIVEDCKFSYNSPTQPLIGYHGAVVAASNSINFVGKNTFDHNSLSNDLPLDTDETQMTFGASLVITQDTPEEYTISNLEFKDSKSKHYAGAIGILAGDYDGNDPDKKNLFIRIENCRFTDCTSELMGGAIKCGIITDEKHYDNDVCIYNCNFLRCKSELGGGLYFQDGDADGDEETVVQYCTFDGCIGSTGSAIFCRSYKFMMSHSIIKNSKPYGSTTDLSETESIMFVYLNEAGIQPVVDNCTFLNNEQNIEFQSHGPVVGDENPISSINFTNCNFRQNNQESNGADSIVDLQYILSLQVTFYECLFEDNAGQCIKQESDVICETHITRCTFNANHGGTGCAIYAASTIEGSKEPLITIDSCIFSNNKVKASWGPHGCVFCTTTNVKFIGHNQFSNNEVIYDQSGRAAHPAAEGPSFSQGACGAALYIIQETDAEFELSDCIFNKCNSTNYGGAIAIACFEDENLFKKMFINIVGCTFVDCSSNYGGSICSLIEGTIKVDSCQFFGGKATEGADIYVVDDTTNTPSTLTVTNTAFCNSQATGDGGSIYCRSGSILLTSNNFTGCQSGGKGAAAYISANSNTTFENNYIELDKKEGVSAIYYTSPNKDSVLWLEGGCFSATKNSQDKTTDILVFESDGQIQFTNKPCFAGSKEESIQIIGNSALELPDEYFNCDKCEAIVVPPSPSISVPTLPITRPPTITKPPSESLFLPTEDINGTEPDDTTKDRGKKSKLGIGAIIGIVIAVVVVVAVIIVAIIFFLRNRTNRNDIRSEQISQDADNSAYTLESNITGGNEDNQPIWAANSMDQNVDQNVDPFMKDFEESVI